MNHFLRPRPKGLIASLSRRTSLVSLLLKLVLAATQGAANISPATLQPAANDRFAVVANVGNLRPAFALTGSVNASHSR